ncbi:MULTISPECIES: DUF4114 domain-containing protein [unclassified Moorena]|uniref:DUF4114 domain-containing protein n=1 Tax=unclassified Moorena TaxID=2683338 RepID=UPI0014001A2B|nr:MULTISPECIES: DUF4114 domain-containing protein [unclassified Moorena]NEO14025.1 DUF4114 domain-containing protein [Moorena sp. SIO3E8]NEQ00500.1 DUF4114 domain-containing protein [Moorena sp. SIO3F7]
MTRIEAENFSSITNFVTTSNPDASGDAVITLFDAVNNTAFPPGTASTSFNQPTGTYEVIIGIFDEIDGESTVDVRIGSTVFPTITLNNPSSTASGIPEASTFVPLQISSSTFIRNGDLIEVKGTADGEEFIRFDYIEFNLTNELPVAVDDTATTTEDTTVNINVLDNDSDTEGDSTLTVISDPSNGSAVVDDNGTPDDLTDDFITYTPNPDYNGPDSFTYQLNDGVNPADTATVNITVTPVNDAPDGTAVVNNNGTLDNTNDDVITDTPDPDFSGNDSLIDQVSDGNGGLDTAIDQVSDGNGGLDTATVDITVNSIPTFVPSTLTQNPNNTFTITSDTTGNAQLLFSFISRNATNVNEIGVFVTDDDQGTVNGIAPGQEGYVEAALSNAQTIFSVLLNPEDSGQTTRLINNFDVGDQLGFYLVQNSTKEAVLAGQNASVFFGDASFNSDGLDHIQSETNSDGVLTLNFEDADDQDFDDLVVTVQDASALTPIVGTGNPQIQGQVELLDLTDVTGTVTPEIVVSSQAVFENSFGFYQVDDASGKIGNLNPGDAGYAELAISNQVDLASGVSGGVLLAPFLIANGTVEEFLTQNPTNQQGSGLNAYFSFLPANPDQFDHVRLLGDNRFGFEDTFAGGDLDYDDLVVEVIF